MSDTHSGAWTISSGGTDVSPERFAAAKKLVAQLKTASVPSGLGVSSRRIHLADGTAITATILGAAPVKVQIEAPKTATKPESNALFDLWAPRGFLVYPATPAAPRGVGLPVVVSSTTSDPNASANLDPGLDFARWTPGGPHGQVLLTRDKDAGYPGVTSVAVPMYYGATAPTVPEDETFDTRKDDGAWFAFRPSYNAGAQHFTTDFAAAKHDMFTAVNAYRASNAVAQAYLVPRGFYQPAENLAYFMDARGVDQTAYPSGYQTTDERLNKDGAWAYTAGQYKELVAVGGSPSGVVSSWAASYSASLLFQPLATTPVFANVGFSGGNWALTTQTREHWIMAGRRVFQSADIELPPISWDGPPALNLGWMTLPIVYANETIYAPTAPLVVNGKWWCSYYTGTNESRPAIGPYVYCRGRALGVLPNGGLVLGAGIVALPGVDRLVVIGYHPTENAALDLNTQGLMAVVHIWYVDLPYAKTLRLHAENPISGTIPPDGTINPPLWWSDGGTQTLPGIKYESFWEFAPDGSKSVCLRDGAALSDIGYALKTPLINGTFVPGRVTNTWSGAFTGVVCEITTGAAPIFPATTTALAAPALAPLGNSGINNVRASLYPANPVGVPSDCWASEPYLQALAAGYKNGAVHVAYYGNALLLLNRTDPRLPPPDAGAYQGPVYSGTGLNYLMFGGVGVQFASDPGNLVLVGSSGVGYDDGYATPSAPPHIVDIASETAVADLQTASQYISAFTPDPTFPASYYTVTTATPAGHLPAVINTPLQSRRVRVFQRGGLLNESAYSTPFGVPWSMYGFRTVRAPDGTYYTPSYYGTGGSPPPADTSPVAPAYVLAYDSTNAIYSTASTHIFPSVPSQTLQPFYAQRFGEEVTGYEVGLASPCTELSFGTMTNPVLQDRAAAFAGNITQTITADQRTVVGGWFKASFSAPDTGAGWFNEVLVV